MTAAQNPRPAATQVPSAPAVAATPRASARAPSAAEIYEALQNQRTELGRQMDRLEEQRRDISRELQQPNINAADEKALEGRLAVVDQRIATVEKQLTDADAGVAKQAAVPGSIVPPAPFERNGPPDEVYVLAGVFMFVVLLPLSIAYARRIWKRSATVLTKLPQEIYDRFARVDQSLDAIAVEVERIGEGQRFLTKMHTEQARALGAGPAERVEMPERERQRERK